MALKLKKKFALRKSTPDLSEWGKHDAKLIDALNKNDMHKINSVLTKKGISPTKLDPSGQSVFHRAAAENKPEALKIFITHKADVNCRNVDDKTPLHCACAKGNVECMEILLQAGASPLCEDRDRQTPLHCAASAGYLDIIEFLMRVQDAPINKPNAHGQMPLHLATKNGHIKVCQELIRNGADVNMRDSSHRTPLMFAASRGNVHLVQLLLKNGADPLIKDREDHDAYWYASSAGKTDVAAFIRKMKTSPDKKTAGGGQHYMNLEEDISVNGSYRKLDVRTSVEPISDEELSDDDNGFLVPIDQHPSTSSKDLKPQYAQYEAVADQQQEAALKTTGSEGVYEEVREESKQLTAHRVHMVTNTAESRAERIRLDIASNYEKEIENLREMLEKEKEKTSKMEEQIQLLQSTVNSPLPQRRIEPSTSEKDLHELSAFGEIQEAHEKEVSDLNTKIEELRRAIEDYCDENKILKSNRIAMEGELSKLQSQITQLRVDTGSVPVDVEVEELIQNRMRIDEELKQVQTILENLRQTLPTGSADGSLMQEVERLRRENATLQSDNRKLQLTISDIRSQLESLQELAEINKQLMHENSQLKDNLETSQSRKPVIIESSEELRQYNADLVEENERLHQENAKLLAQVYQIQKDVEDSMSKLPNIEEFLATKRENEEMKAKLVLYTDSLQKAVNENKHLKQKMEDMRVLLAAAKSRDQDSNSQEHIRHTMALKEIVERLKEQNDILELEREQWSHLSERKELLGESEFPHLQTENAALKEMVERQRQEIEMMQSCVPKDVEKAMKELSNKNKELELTVAKLTDDLMALKSAKLADTPSSAADEDGVMLSSDVEVLNAVPQPSSTPGDLAEGNKKLRSETAPLEDIVAQRNLISSDDTLELKQRNMALTEMVSNLKERNEILEQQLANGKTRTSISSNETEDKATADKELLTLREMIDRLKEENEILLAENLSQRTPPAEASKVDNFEVFALREMVKRLKEQNEILQAENVNQQPQSWVKTLADDAKVIGMQEIIKRLKEDNEILQLQVLQSAGENRRPLSLVSETESAVQQHVCDEQLSDKIMPEAADVVAAAPHQTTDAASSLQTQVIALSEMVERLKERNDMLEGQLVSADGQSGDSQPVSIKLHSEADANNSSLREENCALKEMVRRLREQNDILEQEAQQKVPRTVVETTNLNPKEVIALKEMVIRLKEHAETLETENERLRNLEDGQKVQMVSKDTDTINRENTALKEMIVRLKEQLDTQEQQILASKIKEAPLSSETVDNSELVKENTVLKEMLERLKEQLEIAANEQNAQTRLDAEREVANKGALEHENTALKEIIEQLKEQIVTLELELQASKQPSLTSESSRATDASDSSNEEILALREMVERLREEIEILNQYKDVGKPGVGDEVVRPQQVDILLGAHPDRAGDLSALQKENLALTQMVNSLKEKCDQLESAKAQLEYNSSSEDEWGLDPQQQLKLDQLLRENRAQKEIIARLQEELEVCQASLEKNLDSDFSDSDRDIQPNINNIQYANNVCASTNNKTEALEAMLASQKERIEILEAEQMARKLNKPLDIWSDDTEKVKMRAEIERLEVQLAEAVKLSQAIDPSSDIVELRNMVNLLNERNKELEEQVVQVTTMNKEIGRQMAINEQLSARNKALEVMIAQLSGELTAGDSDQEGIIEQQQVEAVKAAPKPNSGETDLLHLREEKNALKEMVKSLKERVEILENELELDKERCSNSEVVPMSSDLESDNTRLRETVAMLEGLLEEARRQRGDDSHLRAQNTALQHVVESQKEKIESLEVELDQKLREVIVEVRDTKTITSLEQMIASQRDKIEELESEIDQKPKEIIVEVMDTKTVEALRHIVENQKEQIENLQSELDQNPKEIYVEVQDSKTIDALQQMITSQKERIETLEAELCQKPREVKVEINRIDEAMKEMLASQKEHIENLESILDQRETELPKTDIDHSKLEALQQLVLSQKEYIEDLEAQLDQRPKEVVVHVEDVSARLALEEIIERQKEDIQRLEHELKQIPRAPVAEDSKRVTALKEMVESQSERIEDLEKELEQASVMIERVIPTEAANQKIAALEQMLESLREQASIASRSEARDEDMAEIIRLRGVIEQLLDENRSLQTALSSFREGYDGVQDDQEPSLPEEITLVHAAQEQAAVPRTTPVRDTDGGDRSRDKIPCQTKLAALIKENHALRAIVDSQAEHLEILAKELDMLHLASASRLQEDRPDVQTQALREMVVSLTERIEILENQTKSEDGDEQLKRMQEETAPLATTVDCPEHETEIAALRQMVASQKERIEILEREVIHPDDSSFEVLAKESMHSSESSKPEAASHIEEPKYPDEEKTIRDLLERNENLSRINTELQNQLEDFEELDRLAEELQREKDALLDENRELKEELFNLRQLATFGEELRRERDNAIEDRERIQEELSRLQDVLRNSDDIDRERYIWADERERLKSELLGLKKTIDEQTKLLVGSERNAQSLQEENEDLRIKLEILNCVVDEKDKELKRANERLNETEEALVRKLAQLQGLLSTKDQELKQQEGTLADAEKQLSCLKEQLAARPGDTEEMDEDKERILEENEALLEQNFELMSEIQKLKKEIEERVVPIVENTIQQAAPPSFASSRSPAADDILQRENQALKEMISSLQERIDILEAQREPEAARNVESHSYTPGSDSDGELKTEIMALREIVRSQNEQIEILQTGVGNKDELPRKDDMEDLKRENTSLREMLQTLQEENETLKVTQHERSPVSADTDIEELKMKNEELIDENEQLHENIAHLQKLLQKASDELHDDNTELLDENEYLKDSIESLKNEIDTLRSHQAEDPNQDKALALEAMIERLKEERDSLESEIEYLKAKLDEKSESITANQASDDLTKENIALKAMIERLKEEIQPKDQTSDVDIEHGGKKTTEQSSDDLVKENIALKELVASLTDDKRQLEAELDNRSEPARKPATVAVTQLIEAPVYSEQLQASIVPDQMAKNIKDEEDVKGRGGSEISDSRDEEIVALKAMIERLKEENDVLSHQQLLHSHESSSEMKSDTDYDELMKENMALKAMIDRLKEENESQSHQLHEQSSQVLPITKTESDQGDLTKEIVALKAMIEHLKEENETLNHQLHEQSPQTLPVIRGENDQSDLVKENIALKAMIGRLKEEIQPKDQTSDVDIEHGGKKTTEQSSDDLVKENIALKELVASLTDDKRRLEAELDNRSEPARKPATVAVAQLIEAPVYSEQLQASIVPDQMAKNIKDEEDVKGRGGSEISDSRDEEIVALKAMIERLKEENDVLSHQQLLHSHESSSEMKSDTDYDELMKENMALKAMIDRLKEENESQSHQLHEQSSQVLPITKTESDQGDLTKEIVALKAMIEHLKEENETLNHQLHEQSPQTLPVIRGENDQSDLVKENIALKAMIGRLKEEIQPKDQTSDVDIEHGGKKTTEQSSDDLVKENIALKELVASLTDDKRRLEAELDNRSEPARKPATVAVTQLIEAPVYSEQLQASIVPDQMAKNIKDEEDVKGRGGSEISDSRDEEIVALKAMIERLKEENDVLSHQQLLHSHESSSEMKSDTDYDELMKENMALKAMIDRLKEENESQSHQLHEQSSQVLPITKTESDQGDLTKEIVALKAMIEHLKEENETLNHQLHEQSPQTLPVIRGENDQSDLVKENIALKAMIERLKEEIQPKDQTSDVDIEHGGKKTTEQSSDDLVKENIALKELVASLADDKRQLEAELDNRSEPARKPATVAIAQLIEAPMYSEQLQASIVPDQMSMNIKDEEDVKGRGESEISDSRDEEIVALKAMIERLKEENEVLSHQLFDQSSQAPFNVKGAVDQSDLMKENLALKAMVERLKEGLQSNDQSFTERSGGDREDDGKKVNYGLLDDLMKENIALKEMIERLKDELNSIQQLPVALAEQPQSAVPNMIVEQLKEENDALKEMVASLKEDKQQLEAELDNRKAPPSKAIPVAQLIEAPVYSDQLQASIVPDQMAKNIKDEEDVKGRGGSEISDSRDEEIVALKAMIERLKEENDVLSHQQLLHSHESSSEMKSDTDYDELMKENMALKAMIDRLKEENESQSHQLHEQSSQVLPITKTESDQGDLTKEIVALKAMIEHLKEENETLNHQLHEQSSQTLPVVRDKNDQSDLVKENIALKAMIGRLKEEIQPKDQTSDVDIEHGGKKTTEQSSDDLVKENIALKELVASLADDKRRLEAELDNRSEPARKPATVAIAQLIEAPMYSEQLQAEKGRGESEISDSRDEEIVALKAMIERLKEENEVLSHQLFDQSSQAPYNVDGAVDQSDLTKENLALKAMVERLKEEQQSKDHDGSHTSGDDEREQKSDRSLDEILKENTALKAIIERLEEEVESLHSLSTTQDDRLQPAGHDAIETRSVPQQITETSLGEVGDRNDLQKEIVALKAMIEQLRDENETLGHQLEEQGSQHVSGVKDVAGDQSDLMKENAALKAMVESLKEQIDSLQQLPTTPLDQPRLPTTVADAADKKETAALEAMVESLKEDRDLLAKQLEQLKAELEVTKTDGGTGDSVHPKQVPGMEADTVRRENIALKAMLEGLKEQISILENERIMKESPELDRLTTENQILKADICHLEKQLSEAKPERYEREIAALRETIERLKDESGEHRREQHSEVDDSSLRLKNFELRLAALQKERDDLLEQTMTLSEQIDEMQHDFFAKTKKMQNDIDELMEENTNLKAALERHPDVEQVKEAFSAEVLSGKQQKEIEKLKDSLNNTAFEKIQLAGEIEQLKERIEVIQKELESRKQEAAYLQTENSDLRGLLATIQDTSKIPPDQLVARMKEENQKLQQFIQTLNDKVDKILSPEGMVLPVAQVEREKLSIENQLLTLQRQMERLELTLEEERRKTREIVNTYRSHLLAAVQGQMDPEVRQALLHIIRLRGSTAGSRTVSATSGTSEPIPGIDASPDHKV